MDKPTPHRACPNGPIEHSEGRCILAVAASSYKRGTHLPEILDPYHRWLGIPPKYQPPNCYRLLGLELFEEDAEVIRDAAEQRMAHVRTYQLGQYSELSQRILNELAAAKACLLDPQKKAVYDRQLQAFRGGPDALGSVAEFLPTLRAMPPALGRPTPRPGPHWLAPSVVGGIALLVVGMGVAFALIRNPAPVKMARVTDRGRAVKPRNAEEPLPRQDGQKSGRSASRPAGTPVAAQPPTRQAEPEPAEQSKPVVPPSPAAIEASPSPEAPAKALKPAEPEKLPGEALKPPEEKSETPSAAKDPSGTANNDAIAISADEVRKWLPITLPSGAAVTGAMLSVPKNWQNTLFPSTANVFTVRYKNRKLQGVFTLDGVKLHGAAATLHQNGHLETLVTFYAGGLRDGCVKLWDEGGKQRLYAQYRLDRKHDQKHGVFCFFQDGIPWLIQEWENGQSQNAYLVKWTRNGPLLLSRSRLDGDEITQMSTAEQQLLALERKMNKNERELKKKLTNCIVGISNQGKLNNSLDRIHVHNAAKSAEANTFWRSALSRSGF